jgi:hypothetical protein
MYTFLYHIFPCFRLWLLSFLFCLQSSTICHLWPCRCVCCGISACLASLCPARFDCFFVVADELEVPVVGLWFTAIGSPWVATTMECCKDGTSRLSWISSTKREMRWEWHPIDHDCLERPRRFGVVTCESGQSTTYVGFWHPICLCLNPRATIRDRQTVSTTSHNNRGEPKLGPKLQSDKSQFWVSSQNIVCRSYITTSWPSPIHDIIVHDPDDDGL